MRSCFVLILAVALTVACGDGDDRPQSPTPSASPTQTSSPEPTRTSTPTPTPTPTMSTTPEPTIADRTVSRFFSDEFDVSFEYERAPDEFVLDEFRDPEPGLPVAWSIVRRSELDRTPQNAFGPRGIVIEVFDVDPVPPDAVTWVRGTDRSNFGFSGGELATRSVDGVTGVEYGWSGLHEARSVVVVAGERVWMFTATYRDDFDEIEQAFDALLDSVSFGN